MRLFWSAAALAAALQSGSVAAALQTSESLTVEVVNVPVYVRRDGAPVEGLTRDDFELLVNGKPQPIEYFEVIDHGGAAAAPAAEPNLARDVRQRRLFLLVFDLCFGGPFALLRGQKAASAFLENAGPQDSFGVMVCRKSSGFDLAVPFTTDRPAVRRAIAQLRASDDDDPLRMTITATERASFMRPPTGLADAEALSDDSGGPLSRFGNAGGGGGPAAAEGVAAGDNAAQPVRREIENLMVGFAEIARNISRLEGQKHIVFMSEGFSTGMLLPDGRLMESMQRMYHSFQAADTFLHTVDTAGLRLRDANPSLHMLAEGTGGEWVHNRNDLGVALGDLARAHSVEYLLGFTPRNRRRGYNTIEVRVKGADRGTDVTYRRGFSTDAPGEAASAMRLSDILLNDIPQTGTAADLALVDRALLVRIPDALAQQLRNGQAADLYVYVFDAHGAGMLSRKSRVTATSKGFKITLDLPPGRYAAKALLVVGDSIGFTRVDLTLP